MATKEKYTEDELWSFPIGEPMDKPNGDGWYLVDIACTSRIRKVKGDTTYEITTGGCAVEAGSVSDNNTYNHWRRIQLPDEQPDRPRTELGHTIKPGMWKTRDGRKAAVTAEVHPSPFTGKTDLYPFKGWVDGSHCPSTWTTSGNLFARGESSENDLMEPWVDPEEWNVVVYRTPEGLMRSVVNPTSGFFIPGEVVLARVNVRDGDGIEDKS